MNGEFCVRHWPKRGCLKMVKHLHKCPECGMSKDSWHHGNVCPDGPKLGMPHSQYEEVNPTKSNDRAFRTGWSVVKRYDDVECKECQSKLRDGIKNFTCKKCGSTSHDMGLDRYSGDD